MKDVADIWPLVPMQELMLAHALAEPESPLLVQQFYCSITGPLDTALLRRAWQVVVDRHALLRAAPVWEGLKRPVQVVRCAAEVPCTERDWRGATAAEQLERRDAMLAAVRDQGFDLSRPPLMRLDLARLDEEKWLFVWTCHHLILDGWCLGIVLGELFQCYERLRREEPLEFEPCGSLANFLTWLAAQDRAAADRFWRDQLRDLGTPARLGIELSAAERAPLAPGHASRCLWLSEDETRTLAQAATKLRVSQSTLVQAAWAILLARYLDQQDIVFGAAVSGRPPEVPLVEKIVGPLSNNVPRRVHVAADDPLAELCGRLNRCQIDAQPYEYCSPQHIAETAGVAGGRLFHSLVVYENYPLHGTEQWSVGDLTIHDLHGTVAANYPLTLVALPGRELELRVLYDVRQYAAESAVGLLDQVATLLGEIVRHPDARVGDLALAARADSGVTATAWAELSPEESLPAVCILDPVRQPAPVGMAGELWVEVPEARDHGVASSNGNGNGNGHGHAPWIADAGKPCNAAHSGPCQFRHEKSILDPRDPRQERRLRSTGYRARYTSEGELEFLGPAAGTRMGRYSVDTAEVVAVAELHPLVARAAVVAYQDREGCTQLAAYLAPAPNAAIVIESAQPGHLVLGEVYKFLEDRLPKWMVPTAWHTLDRLPENAAGQVDVAALPPPVTPRPATSGKYIGPRDPLESQLVNIWSQVLGVEPVGVTDSFQDLGGHSSLAVMLIARIEEECGRRLPLAALFAEPTIEHLAQLLRQPSAGAAASSLVTIRPDGTSAPLFCVHPAGGTVFCYLELAQLLPADIPVYGLQAQGVDGTAVPHGTIEEMATHYIEALKSLQPTGPYRICGWSTGGIVAFEIARQLRAGKEEVSLVALFDAAIAGPDNALGESDLVPMLQLLFPGADPEELQGLRERPVAEQVDYFRRHAEKVGVLLAGTGARSARWVFDIFEANMKAVLAYCPQPLDIPLVLFCAAEQATPMHADPLLGWGPWAAGGTDVHIVPGGHLTMLQPPAVTRLSELLCRCLAQPVEGAMEISVDRELSAAEHT